MIETTHEVHIQDASSMSSVSDGSVDLVVTSPPYPMVEMWDDVFSSASNGVKTNLETGDDYEAFDEMHSVLGSVWNEVDRVLSDSGIACINIGDATRKIGDSFKLFPNRTKIINQFLDLGYDLLPSILWRKPSNRSTKFLGSGMVPPNAYVSYEHEHILVFRKRGGTRSFKPKLDERYESSYFWEERNDWFSDLWEGLPGVSQSRGSANGDGRNRTAAYPFSIPYRLINMYSIRGDTVLDPFLGTGTTMLAAMASARNSIGYEIDESFNSDITDRVKDIPTVSEDVAQSRLRDHTEFEEDSETPDCPYEATHYSFNVKTKQESDIRLYKVDSVSDMDSGYSAIHSPVTTW